MDAEMINADFWPSNKGLYEDILGVREQLYEDTRLGLATPEFHLERGTTDGTGPRITDCREETLPRMPFSIPELATKICSGERCASYVLMKCR